MAEQEEIKALINEAFDALREALEDKIDSLEQKIVKLEKRIKVITAVVDKAESATKE